MDIEKSIQKIAEYQSVTCFVSQYVRPDNVEEREERGLALAIAAWAGWDGVKIMRVFGQALEDANFHEETRIVQNIIEKIIDTDSKIESYRDY
jgi:Fe-S cluster assembly ATPase SufC